MKRKLVVISLFFYSFVQGQTEKLIYHDIQLDGAGKIVPWYSRDFGTSYDHAIMSVWHFWDTMRTDFNGLPYYMNHQVWKPDVNDARGIGGDQIQMALSSWRLLYQYCGDERIKENMKFMADYYLSHGLSPSNASWPDIPYPYNTLIYSGVYDGDMVIGKFYTQPDKAGSFGNELVQMYKMADKSGHSQTPAQRYVDAAVKIANTLAKHVRVGNASISPLPFKVHAVTGMVGQLKDNNGNGKVVQQSGYTSNWSGTLELFLGLIELKKGDTIAYRKSCNTILEWMKKYPLQNNRWGPFFEDISGWSDTQINAITFAQFIMNHPTLFPDWKKQVKGIFDWVYMTVGNKKWEEYGVVVVNEQTAYQVPGNSHSSRQASAELQYATLTGDSTYVENAIRTLNWATYMVDADGKNRYPQDDIWLTDGYGDYVRHFLRSFAALPELAPATEDHILSSTSVIPYVMYRRSLTGPSSEETFKRKDIKLEYRSFHHQGEEVIRLNKKPSAVLFNRKPVQELPTGSLSEGYEWKESQVGGVMTIKRTNTQDVIMLE